MNTSQLQCCISCDQILRGHVTVCASDQLPDTLSSLPTGFIVNTDDHSKPGTHWCAFYLDHKGNCEFFDSYGNSPEHYNDYLWNFSRQSISKTVVFNNKKMQSNFSNVCGLYSLFFLHQRFKGVSMNQIVNTFSAFNVYLNDSYIIQFISRLFGNCVKNECVYNQTCKPLVVK